MDNSNLISDEEAKMLLNDKSEKEIGGDDELALEISETNRNNIERILDLKLELSVVIGRTKMSLRDILNLNKGSLIELDTLADQDVEILIDNKVLAYGKVVVVDLNFGVKVTSIVSEEDMVKSLV
ncbi:MULTISPECIES: FliM/FliN family flagellar motor switch protein [unclassified Clostridioides]|uniref:FliM/FliN family flagellar motor switch protein n=1 Tax=unclassified Clostridioides TaxID=2635829 RepID=UPI001D11BEE1|nr:FliM/FliN family flagellar motor switch protein [Clostridioides sp. ZZV15-6388]MCC0644119.1 FliM/FliN family flagellar motor switch protein [Clostridioides sp. ZZV14-6150]MCC0661006.1 FliM/FliN family flagellar motor switch protein [Clostridioides sp. ZZV14-6154]MCC0663325.1 FliM/FliN family flagellar motor switch protein [Clostridioides sp. ZZV15-6597]MCC0668278.1 FliM/FliN family flagellar motor switch protein [Clostridioides sp. ZZV14-6153]MCC0718157.1 FliM/FliN family flagellar motor sw